MSDDKLCEIDNNRIRYNVYYMNENVRYMNWIGVYTYGSTFCRGTRVNVHPQFGMTFDLNYGRFNTPKSILEQYEKDLIAFKQDLKDDCMFRYDNSAFTRFSDAKEWHTFTFVPCSLIDLEPIIPQDVKDLEQTIQSFPFMFRHDVPWEGRFYFLTHAKETLTKIHAEIEHVLAIGNEHHVTYEWI